MSDKITQFDYLRAVDDFRRARGKARLHQLWAEVTGESKELLHFDDITRTMRSTGQVCIIFL